MKQKLFLLSLIFLFAANVQAQVFSKYKRDLKAAKKDAKEQLSEGWPINLDPIEVVPKKQYRDFTAAAQENWGQKILLPDSIKARLQAECRGKVLVKVYDTGGKIVHPYLTQGQNAGSNYTGTPLPDDLQGHSTHVSGIIAANEFGILDALIDNGTVKWKPVKILNDQGSGSFDWFANAVRTEDAENRALILSGWSVVCNGSFGGGTSLVQPVEVALKASTELGVIYNFAAGNTGQPGVNYPGRSQYSLTVASLDENLKRSSYSTQGPELAVAMPGRNILSTYKGGTFATLSGTSMATPFATSLTAIAKSKWGNAIPNQAAMRRYMCWIATDLEAPGRDDLTGWGIAYVRAVLNRNPKDIPPTFNDRPGNENPGDPGNPAPPVRETRTIPLVIAGNFPIFWSADGSLSDAEGAKLISKLSKKKARAQGSQLLTVTEIRYEIASTTSAEETEKQIRANTGTFFTNRGLMLKGPADYYDATLWAAYFLDMWLDTQKKTTVKVTGITAKNPAGNTVTVPANLVRPWPPGSN